jgi:hypothetical protein
MRQIDPQIVPHVSSSLEQLVRAAEMAGRANACEYSCTEDLMAPDYAAWRVRRWVSFAPFLTICLASILIFV